MSAADRVRAIVASGLGVHIDQATPEATFEKLDADSIDKQVLAITIEDTFGIVITDDELADATTVADLVRIVDLKLASVIEQGRAA